MTAAPPPCDLSAIGRILVVKLDEVGDFVLATPFLRGLRAAAPQARILLAVREAVADLAATCPWVDGVVAPRPKEGGGIDFRGITPGGLARFAECYRVGFDLVVVPRYDFDRHGAVTLAANSRSPLVVGFSERVTPWKAEGNRGFDRAFSHVLAPPPGRHEVEQNAALLEFLGAPPDLGPPALALTDGDRAEAARLVGGAGGPRDLLVVAPGAASPRREYPADRLAVAVARLAAALDAHVAVLGTAAERKAAVLIGAALGDGPGGGQGGGFTDLTGATGLRVAAAVLERAFLAVAMDSAPAHLAAAVGTPVAVFSCHPLDGDPTHVHAPDRFRPWTGGAQGGRVLVLRPDAALAPCATSCLAAEAHCIATIDPTAAAERIVAFTEAARKGE
ncbi:glycosyltransferase family 9 protein [Azospirillum picis]|uniref:ADP-heptose:LPS heptosyltransferase n=1 Tax=Azospirillum picis TaxID=488438 RepID=A0ABU0MU06_9PROT|nr:glycosyltransferase family 9 protein [Azospirillum picis]MBP2302921.1 ADP-heptose:LPS heptosyltransferase [Azospirillum picis]MDQ0536673.1 ADP-heptose:LPS heptosyltransferase [Azospirillum picis]